VECISSSPSDSIWESTPCRAAWSANHSRQTVSPLRDSPQGREGTEERAAEDSPDADLIDRAGLPGIDSCDHYRAAQGDCASQQIG